MAHPHGIYGPYPLRYSASGAWSGNFIYELNEICAYQSIDPFRVWRQKLTVLSFTADIDARNMVSSMQMRQILDIMYERHGPLWPVFAGQTGDGAYVKCLQSGEMEAGGRPVLRFILCIHPLKPEEPEDMSAYAD